MTDEKLANATFSYNDLTGGTGSANPWGPQDIDKMEIIDLDNFIKITNACRFFYRHDAITSTVVNKMIDIGINGLQYNGKELNANETKIMDAILPELEEFGEAMALEYLISGLVVPEVKIAPVTKEVLKEWGIKKYETLKLPVALWLRDPTTIKINYTMVMDKPSYYVKVPDALVYFITHDGTYPDGNKDELLFAQLKAYYPDFVIQVTQKAKNMMPVYVLLENHRIFRRRPLTDSPYPTPFLYASLESLKHKRNLRRMDYSIASRVISAIQLFRLGDKDFPVTEDQGDQFTAIRDQMTWRNSGGRDIERIFQLFANHTLQIDWIYPPVEALLDEQKYVGVNQDIIFGMGFPRILITGETEKSSTSQPEYATMSPMKTLEKVRQSVLRVLNSIVDEIFEENKFKGETEVSFKPINLVSFGDLVTGLAKLYDTQNISRTSFAEAFGYDYEEELGELKQEKETLEEMGMDEITLMKERSEVQMEIDQEKQDKGLMSPGNFGSAPGPKPGQDADNPANTGKKTPPKTGPTKARTPK